MHNGNTTVAWLCSPSSDTLYTSIVPSFLPGLGAYQLQFPPSAMPGSSAAACSATYAVNIYKEDYVMGLTYDTSVDPPLGIMREARRRYCRRRSIRSRGASRPPRRVMRPGDASAAVVRRGHAVLHHVHRGCQRACVPRRGPATALGGGAPPPPPPRPRRARRAHLVAAAQMPMVSASGSLTPPGCNCSAYNCNYVARPRPPRPRARGAAREQCRRSRRRRARLIT